MSAQCIVRDDHTYAQTHEHTRTRRNVCNVERSAKSTRDWLTKKKKKKSIKGKCFAHTRELFS